MRTLAPLVLVLNLGVVDAGAKNRIPNRYIDYAGFNELTGKLQSLRESRRVTEGQFIEMASDDNTVILDTRSVAQYAKLHVTGAVHLNFSDITRDTLSAAIPSTVTRILIYCNNNFENAPDPFPTKLMVAALNVPTFITLTAYGYENVYELGPVIDPARSEIDFAGMGISQ